jgi:RimJ/RimL family protein N-acetyltransferase
MCGIDMPTGIAGPEQAAPARPAALPDRAPLIESWRLADGTPITLRPIRVADTRLELDFLNGLSPHTRYQRALSARKLLPGELRRLTQVDYRRDMALVATARQDGVETFLGVARYVRLADDVSAEFAIVIADAWQRRGLGAKLLVRLVEAACAHRLQVLVGFTLTTNVRMLALARQLGFTMQMDRDDATLTHLRRLLPGAPASSFSA